MHQRGSAEARRQAGGYKARLARGQGRGGGKVPLGTNGGGGGRYQHLHPSSLSLPSQLEPLKYPPPLSNADIHSDHCPEEQGREGCSITGKLSQGSSLQDQLPPQCTYKRYSYYERFPITTNCRAAGAWSPTARLKESPLSPTPGAPPGHLGSPPDPRVSTILNAALLIPVLSQYCISPF